MGMDKKVVVEKIFKAYQAQSTNLLGSSSGPSWAFQSQAIQPDLNQAIIAWLKHDDPVPLKGIVTVMQTMGVLSDTEADKLLLALEPEEK